MGRKCCVVAMMSCCIFRCVQPHVAHTFLFLGRVKMAKCRNCKKEIDANATRCPYCLTEMPTSNTIANIKGAFIALILLGVFGLAMYFFVDLLISQIGMVLGLVIMFVFFIVGIFAFIFALAAFSNAKKDTGGVGLNILIGLTSILISITLFVVGFILAVSVMS